MAQSPLWTADRWRAPLADDATPTKTGFLGAGAGRSRFVPRPKEWTATTVQACGMWPLVAGSSLPAVGVPLGHHIEGRGTVHFDPITAFTKRLIQNPSLFVLGLTGWGKSTFVRRIVIGTAFNNVTPMVLGDLKPDYVPTVAALGGQIIKLGRGYGALNVLDVGALGSILPQLRRAHDAAVAQARRSPQGSFEGGRAEDRAALLEDKIAVVDTEVRARRQTILTALIKKVRHGAVTDHESVLLHAAMSVLDRRFPDPEHPPLIKDLIAVFDNREPEIVDVALTRTSDEAYWSAVDPLIKSLMALTVGELGAVFAQPTTVKIDLDAPAVCIDMSGISRTDTLLRAAALMACWHEGFATIEAAHILADAGLAPQRNFLAVMDELWKSLAGESSVVDEINELTRTNRTDGTGQIMVTHSLADLDAVRNDDDRQKARGFIERAGAVAMFALPHRELDQVSEIVPLTDEEKSTVAGWTAPGGIDPLTGDPAPPAGRGHALLKLGSAPGMPLEVVLTDTEKSSDVHNTNQRWSNRMAPDSTPATPEGDRHGSAV